MILILFYILVFCLCYFGYKSNENNLLVNVSLFSLLFLFSGFALNFGPDWKNYESLYLSSPEIIYDRSFEPLFILLSHIYSSYGLSYVFVQASYAFLSLLFIFLTIKKFPYMYTSIFIYVSITDLYIQNMIGFRQSLAVSITFYASVIYFLENRKIYSFLIISTAAFLIHYSALICIGAFFIFPILKKQYSSYLYITSYFISLIIGYFGVIHLFYSLLDGRYNYYSTVGGGGILRMLFPSSLAFLIIYISKYRIYDRLFIFMMNYLFFGILIFNIFLSNIYMLRFWNYFEIATIYFIPYLIYKQKNVANRYTLFFIFAAYFFTSYSFIVYKYISEYDYNNLLIKLIWGLI
ncbi:hypothetical protein B4919_02920 [Francisella tularensis subsp. novicida]|uniref:EpsG family protein n=1 Tax=Francisella tularensis TaxID=263 RepID=UPI000CE2A226|nr:hypothetical protein B4919_02920 [Francisella tularensis subsp. novicida]